MAKMAMPELDYLKLETSDIESSTHQNFLDYIGMTKAEFSRH